MVGSGLADRRSPLTAGRLLRLLNCCIADFGFIWSVYQLQRNLPFTYNCHLLSADVDGQDAIPLVPSVDFVHRRGSGRGWPVPEEVQGMAQDGKPFLQRGISSA